MFCNIYQWFISGSMDTGKSLPKPVLRHLDKCLSCKRFAEMGNVLNNRLVRDTPGILKNSPEDLSNRIISNLHHLKHASNKTYNRSKEDLFAPRRRSFSLAITSAAVVLILIAGFLWFGQQGTPTQNQPAIDTATLQVKLPDVGHSILNLGTAVESPLETELKSLENAVISAKSYFASYLDRMNITKKDIKPDSML